MKLRMKGSSLRLRVSPSEMVRLIEAGRIEEITYFAPHEDAKLTYALEHSPDQQKIAVRYQPHEVAVVVPSQEARAWAAGNEVGLYGSLEVLHGKLELIIEKDFACLDRSDAENQDTFANPHMGAVC